MNYSPSSCGLFGVLRKFEAEKISGKDVVDSLELIRYRGSNKGSGYASFDLTDNNYYMIKTFYDGSEEDIKSIFNKRNIFPEEITVEDAGNTKSYCFNVTLENNDEVLDKINEELWLNRDGRVYSAGKSLNVFKGVGYPLDVATSYNVQEKYTDMWLAHTRQPTNSPGNYPYWSHPFSSYNIAIVHNGDISSFGANREFLISRGIKSLVGTDSEVIAYLFRELLKEFDLETTIKILSNNCDDPKIKYEYRGAVLDGPYTLIIGYDTGDDLYMICMTDKTKLRPVIIGTDQNNYYIASEENQIRNMTKNATVWPMEPGSYFIASMKNGIINYGVRHKVKDFVFFTDDFDIDASGIKYNELDDYILKSNKNNITVSNILGHRYIGIKFPAGNKHLKLYGNPGNCLMNLNHNNDVDVYGNVADDCCDTMTGGSVRIHGNAGDVFGQAFQNGRIYVLGNVGNRSGIQMRAYKDFKPEMVINGGFADYLGEYMSGGLILSFTNNNAYTGKYIGSGMIGGKILIRKKIKKSSIGMQPPDYVVKNMLKALLGNSLIDRNFYDSMKNKNIIDIVEKAPEEAKKYVEKLLSKHEIPEYEYRKLNAEELSEIKKLVLDFDSVMGTNNIKYLNSVFTVITPRY